MKLRTPERPFLIWINSKYDCFCPQFFLPWRLLSPHGSPRTAYLSPSLCSSVSRLSHRHFVLLCVGANCDVARVGAVKYWTRVSGAPRVAHVIYTFYSLFVNTSFDASLHFTLRSLQSAVQSESGSEAQSTSSRVSHLHSIGNWNGNTRITLVCFIYCKASLVFTSKTSPSIFIGA